MDKPTIEKKSENKFHLLPKSQQFDMLQRYRDLRAPKIQFITAKEEVQHDKIEDLFVSEIVRWNLSKEWMTAISNGRP